MLVICFHYGFGVFVCGLIEDCWMFDNLFHFDYLIMLFDLNLTCLSCMRRESYLKIYYNHKGRIVELNIVSSEIT